MSALRAEAVVIGSGPGGATTAHLLAERGRDVIVLEEGPHLPLESCVPFSMEEMAQKYRAGGLNPALGRAKVAFAEARTMGGGSEINSGLYHRTPEGMLEWWRAGFGLRRSSPQEMAPHFEYCEQALGVSTDPAGAPLASRKLADGAARLGWRAMEVPRWFKAGVRQSMTKTFLPRAERAGARLLSQTRAVRLRRREGGWTVETVSHGRRMEIEAGHVFVCGGALQTPLLLRRSGIQRNVGNTLAMHPTVKLVALFDDEVNHERMGVPVHQVKEFAPRLSFGCSISSLPHLALALAGQEHSGALLKERWRNLAIYYAMITGPNSGTVRAVPGCTDPLIHYRLAPEDLRDLGAGLRKLARLLLAAGARAVYPAIAGAKPIRGEGDLSTIPGALDGAGANLMTIHLFSSCPMGDDADRCAVDSLGRVHGAEGLSVHDASVIPTALGVNPQGTVMALARRNTLHYLGEN